MQANDHVAVSQEYDVFLTPKDPSGTDKRGPKSIDIEVVKHLLLTEEMSVKDVASQLGCSVQNVHRLVRIRNIKRNVYRRNPKAEYRSFPTVGCILGAYWAKAVHNAKTRRIHWDLDQQDAWRLFLAQEGRCWFTGVPLIFARTIRHLNYGLQTASLDRISHDKQVGYRVDNVIWVHKDINDMRGKLGVEAFVTWCGQVASHKAA